jgi:hypothetical protein
LFNWFHDFFISNGTAGRPISGIKNRAIPNLFQCSFNIRTTLFVFLSITSDGLLPFFHLTIEKKTKDFVNPLENNIFVSVNDEGSTGLLLFCLSAYTYQWREKRLK